MNYYDLKTYFLLFIIYSFLGWLLEVINSFIKEKKFINRGFLLGPLCPIYGFGTIAILILLKDNADHPVSLFINAIFICSILEYFTSFFMEKLFNARWWDYSNRKFNINGRICLETMIPFGLAAAFVWYIVNPQIINIINLLSSEVITIITFILLGLLVIDLLISFNVVYSYKKTINKISTRDITEDFNKYVKKVFESGPYLTRRLVFAFPKIDFQNLKEKLVLKIKNKK